MSDPATAVKPKPKPQDWLVVSKNLVEFAKNVVLLAVLVWVFYEGRPAFKKTLDSVVTGERYISELSLEKSGKISVKFARDTLQQAITQESAAPGTKDQPVTLELKKSVLALEQLNEAVAASGKHPDLTSSGDLTSAWVYLGIEKDGKWNPNNFGLSGAPLAGVQSTAHTDVFERDVKPYEEAKDVWKLGKVTGLVHQGDSVIIREVAPIEADNGGMNWWARVQVSHSK
jgi:hypothetical protein